MEIVGVARTFLEQETSLIYRLGAALSFELDLRILLAQRAAIQGEKPRRKPPNLFFYFVVFANATSLLISVLLTWSNFSRLKGVLKIVTSTQMPFVAEGL